MFSKHSQSSEKSQISEISATPADFVSSKADRTPALELSFLDEISPDLPPSLPPQNEPILFIHGNNSSDAHKQGLPSFFDDFNPDYSSTAFSDRLTRYAAAHKRAVEMSDFIKKIYRSTSGRLSESARVIASQLRECGSFLLFHHFHTVNQIKLASMCSCKRHLLCPLCAIRRAAKAVQVYLEKYKILCSLNPHLAAYLVTFTVRNDVDLSERFDHLQKSLRKMYDHRRRYLSSPKRNASNQACKALGGVGSFEIKRGSGSGDWHPHAHYIWLCESAPDAKELAQEWQEITGDSFIVDVTPFYDPENVSKGFLEVFKYALKYSTMDLSDNWEAFQVLQGKRLVSSFGIFYGLEIPEQLTDEISFDELPYVELVFRYLNGSYQLTQSTNQ